MADSEHSTSRRGLFVAAMAMPVAAPLAAAPAAAAAGSPDADLIHLCGEHLRNMEVYNSNGGHLEPEDDPLWARYERTLKAISNAQPRTLEGMIAKARAAKAEARMPDGAENPRGTIGEVWAWDLMDDLLRLARQVSA